MSNTTNYNLNKPTYGTRNWDIPLNQNFDVIDSTMKEIDDKIGNLANSTATDKSSIINITNEINSNLNSHLAETTQENVKLVRTTNDLKTSWTLGKNLILMNGTYTLDATVTGIANSITIVGQNGAVIDGDKKAINVPNLQNVEFENITFQNFSEMQFPTAKNITFRKCKFLNFSTRGLVISNFDNVKFIECTINSIGSSAVDETWQGAGIYADKGNKLTVDSCDISRIFGQGGIYLLGVTNIYIRRNKIYDTAFRAIHFYTGVSTGLIDDNDIWNCGSINEKASGVGCNGIYSSGSTYDVTISNNRISNVLENGIEGLFGIIDNNTITGTGIDTVNFPTPSVEGIYPHAAYSKTISVRNNKIKNSKGAGIKFFSESVIKNILIADNIIEDDVLNSNSGIDLNSTSGYDSVTISGNTIKNKASVIYIQNKPCVSVNITGNKSINSGLPVPPNKQIVTSDGEFSNFIANRDFNIWTNDTTLESWSVSSGTLSKVVDGSYYVPKLTVTAGGYPGRITQDINLPKINKRYMLRVFYKGNDKLNVKFTPYLIDGVTLDHTNALEINHTDFSETTWKEATLLVYTSATKGQLYIGTGSTQNNYIIIRNVIEKIII
jgi:hypothetical protein